MSDRRALHVNISRFIAHLIWQVRTRSSTTCLRWPLICLWTVCMKWMHPGPSRYWSSTCREQTKPHLHKRRRHGRPNGPHAQTQTRDGPAEEVPGLAGVRIGFQRLLETLDGVAVLISFISQLLDRVMHPAWQTQTETPSDRINRIRLVKLICGLLLITENNVDSFLKPEFSGAFTATCFC